MTIIKIENFIAFDGGWADKLYNNFRSFGDAFIIGFIAKGTPEFISHFSYSGELCIFALDYPVEPGNDGGRQGIQLLF